MLPVAPCWYSHGYVFSDCLARFVMHYGLTDTFAGYRGSFASKPSTMSYFVYGYFEKYVVKSRMNCLYGCGFVYFMSSDILCC